MFVTRKRGRHEGLWLICSSSEDEDFLAPRAAGTAQQRGQLCCAALVAGWFYLYVFELVSHLVLLSLGKRSLVVLRCG